jgi:hypothetical protein
LFGRKLDVGIDNQFIKNVGNDMKPGDSALFLLTENITVDKVADALREYGGTLYTHRSPKKLRSNWQKHWNVDRWTAAHPANSRANRPHADCGRLHRCLLAYVFRLSDQRQM